MRAETPLLSIVTVTKDNLAGLRKTADSMFDFDESLVEWLVIDGASTDGTTEFLDEISAAYNSESDKGIYDAMNKGIASAAGTYILFMNAGDAFASPWVLPKIIDILRTKAPDFLYGDALEDTKQGQFPKPSKRHTSVAWGMFTHHQAMIYRSALMTDLKYDQSYTIAADYHFTCRFLYRAETALHLPQPICVFESGGVSQTNAVLGRREQFAIRKALKLVPGWKNALIYGLQSVSWALRQVFPAVFWRLRRLWQPSGNNASGSSQSQTPPLRP